MSIEFPQYTWMSTGSLQGFKYDYLTPLKEKDITAFPDKGAYNKWKETADVLNNKGFNIEVSKLLETKEYEDGWDLVDMMNYENKKQFKQRDKGLYLFDYFHTQTKVPLDNLVKPSHSNDLSIYNSK